MCVDSLPLMFYLWIKAIPQLGQWKPDTAVSRISCVWASHSFDSLYSSSKQRDICAKMGKKHKIGDHKMTHFDGGIFWLQRSDWWLPGTTLHARWVWKLIWLLLTTGTDFKRLLHLLKHLLLRLEGHGFSLGLHTSSGKTNQRGIEYNISIEK